MRTTLELNEELIALAKKMTKIKTKTDLIHEGLKSLIADAAQRELAQLGGTEKKLQSVPRRKLKK